MVGGPVVTLRRMAGAADPTDRTIESYGEIAEAYAERNRVRAPVVFGFLRRLAELASGATVLDLGSGPGDDAEILERHGLTVLRTDATPAFVDRLRAAGHPARRLDVRRDPLGGPYEAVLANAVLLHLTSAEFGRCVARIRAAVRPGGAFLFTLKEGDGEQFTSAKVGHPRWFTYWREGPLRGALAGAGWELESLEHVAGTGEEWLYVIVRRPLV